MSTEFDIFFASARYGHPAGNGCAEMKILGIGVNSRLPRILICGSLLYDTVFCFIS